MLQAFRVLARLGNLTAKSVTFWPLIAHFFIQKKKELVHPSSSRANINRIYREIALWKGGNKQTAVSYMSCMQEAVSLILMRVMNQRGATLGRLWAHELGLFAGERLNLAPAGEHNKNVTTYAPRGQK